MYSRLDEVVSTVAVLSGRGSQTGHVEERAQGRVPRFCARGRWKKAGIIVVDGGHDVPSVPACLSPCLSVCVAQGSRGRGERATRYSGGQTSFLRCSCISKSSCVGA